MLTDFCHSLKSWRRTAANNFRAKQFARNAVVRTACPSWELVRRAVRPRKSLNTVYCTDLHPVFYNSLIHYSSVLFLFLAGSDSWPIRIQHLAFSQNPEPPCAVKRLVTRVAPLCGTISNLMKWDSVVEMEYSTVALLDQKSRTITCAV